MKLIERALTMKEIEALPRGTVCAADPALPGFVVSVPRKPRARVVWAYRWRDEAGRLHLKTIGPVDLLAKGVALDEAKKDAARRTLDSSYDPLQSRKDARAARRAAKVAIDTGRTVAKAVSDYIAANKATWKSRPHLVQWEGSMAKYVVPVIGKMLVTDVNVDAVRRVLDKIWNTVPETASRVRARLESVLAREAVIREEQSYSNPARWVGLLEHVYSNPLVTKKAKRRATGEAEHHPALPFKDLPAFFADLEQRPGVAAAALQVCILTAVRSEECTAMRWSELDLDNAVWTIPGERMKLGREHRVPLSPRVVEILRARPVVDGGFVFYSRDMTGSLEASSMRKCLHRMGRTDLTVHGFRSTFADWAGETTNAPEELREACLAHGKDKILVAYQRGDMLDKRRALMEAYATFATSHDRADNVVSITKAA
jgi:integrase